MIKQSKRIETINNRLAKLPEVTGNVFSYYTKKEAVGFIKSFQRNLIKNKYGMSPLIDPSIKNKKEQGYTKPDIPLYGAGKKEKNSYYNMFLLRKMKNGYTVYPRWAKHHDSDIELRHLLSIHEYGCTIIVTPKMRARLHYEGIHLKTETYLIRIPPRPIAYLTYRDSLQMWQKRKKRAVNEITKAIDQYVNESNKAMLEKIAQQEIELGKEYQTTDI